jgi:hypothetical protein
VTKGSGGHLSKRVLLSLLHESPKFSISTTPSLNVSETLPTFQQCPWCTRDYMSAVEVPTAGEEALGS